MTCRRLDTPHTRPYKTRPLALAGALLLVAPSLARAEVVVHGAQLPDSARKVAENRYRTTQDFEETLKHFKTTYPPTAYPRKSIINQPGIKAVHIVNPSGKGFEGLNIYETNDEVRIFVIPAGETKPRKKESKPAKK